VTKKIDDPEARKQEKQRQLATVPMANGGMMNPKDLDQAIEVAKLMAHSGMLPKQYDKNTGAVLIAIQMGAELGLSPMAAIQNIAVINGRPSLWGDAMLALVVSHPDCLDVIETCDEHGATCTVKRRGRAPIERSFTLEDAKRAGLLGKQGPWQQYTKRMLQLRARGFALRDAFPDALRGIRSTEEVRDMIIETGDGPAEGTHGFGFSGLSSISAVSPPSVNVEPKPPDEK